MKLILFSILFFISSTSIAQEFTLPELRFSYNSYEQGIDAKTMEIHHSKHHRGYVRKLNKAVSESKLEGKSLVDLLMYASYRNKAVRNNAGKSNHDFEDDYGSNFSKDFESLDDIDFDQY